MESLHESKEKGEYTNLAFAWEDEDLEPLRKPPYRKRFKKIVGPPPKKEKPKAKRKAKPKSTKPKKKK